MSASRRTCRLVTAQYSLRESIEEVDTETGLHLVDVDYHPFDDAPESTSFFQQNCRTASQKIAYLDAADRTDTEFDKYIVPASETELKESIKNIISGDPTLSRQHRGRYWACDSVFRPEHDEVPPGWKVDLMPLRSYDTMMKGRRDRLRASWIEDGEQELPREDENAHLDTRIIVAEWSQMWEDEYEGFFLV